MRYFLLLFIVFILAACGAPIHKTITPELQSKMLQDLKEGKLVLNSQSVNSDLSYTWFSNDISNAYNSQNWKKLAELVMQVGNEKDISYFYLGISAEQLGYSDAALKYYQRAQDLYADKIRNHHCRSFEKDCNGINLAIILPNKAKQLASIGHQATKEQQNSKNYLPPKGSGSDASGVLITEDIIKNLTYWGTTVKNGLAESVTDDSPEIKSCTEVDSFFIGNVNQDGSQDAIVQVADNLCGVVLHVTFIHIIHATQNNFEVVGPLVIGDRSNIKFTSNDRGKFNATLTVHSDRDPPCCPSIKQNTSFEIRNNEVVDSNNFLKKHGIGVVKNGPGEQPKQSKQKDSRDEILKRL